MNMEMAVIFCVFGFLTVSAALFLVAIAMGANN